jgi:hypothetical protein
MKDLAIIFIVLLVLLILISIMGGSIRYTPTEGWRQERFQEDEMQPPAEDTMMPPPEEEMMPPPPPEGEQLDPMPTEPTMPETFGMAHQVLAEPAGAPTDYPTKEAGAALDENLVEPFSGEAFAACSSCSSCS